MLMGWILNYNLQFDRTQLKSSLKVKVASIKGAL